MKEFDQVVDCDMQEGRINWFKGGMLNVTGKSSRAKGRGGYYRSCKNTILLGEHAHFVAGIQFLVA